MHRRVALVQFDAVPEQIERNLDEVERLSRSAVYQDARWVMFHELALCDMTPRVPELCEPVPDGAACRRVEKLARELGCFLSVGMGERDGDRRYITQVFFGPDGFCYRYRKTWLWLNRQDTGYRNEWARFDPGAGPELFEIDGVRATCFICADGEAPRCIERAAALEPAVVFYPNNREQLPDFDVFGKRARKIGAPMLVTNRVGDSWGKNCQGGCAAFAPDGSLLASANREGQEEILICDLEM